MIIPKARSLLIICIAALAGWSCARDRFFEQNSEIPGGSWAAHNNISFPVVIQDTVSVYDFFVNVRNDVDYPFSNLYLFLTTTFPDGRIARDTIECMLAGYDGKWLGSGIGSVRFNRFLFQRNVRFGKAGTYSFEFEQAMRTDPLKGIKDIGIRIDKKEADSR